MEGDSFETLTLAAAKAGLREAAVEAITLSIEGLREGTLSKELSGYLADRLVALSDAIHHRDQLTKIGKSRSANSAFGTATADAFLINRPAHRPRDPLPEWTIAYGAFGSFLLKRGLKREKVKAAMDSVRFELEGKSLDRKDASVILRNFKSLKCQDDDILLYLAGPLRKKVGDFIPHT